MKTHTARRQLPEMAAPNAPPTSAIELQDPDNPAWDEVWTIACEPPAGDLPGLTVAELRRRAAAAGVKHTRTMKKAELFRLLA
jgi:hypothetical protein